MEKSGGHHLNQVVKLGIASSGLTWYSVLSASQWLVPNVIYVMFLLEMFDLNLIARK